MLGLFGGYALGLLSAIAIWMYIEQAPSPFIPNEKVVDNASVKGTVNPVQKNAQNSSADEKPGKPTDGKPRFEFYKILPGAEEAVTEQQFKQAGQRASSSEKYFLQAGSFQNAPDADNLKARLALVGIEASIQTTNLPDKGLWHRVRVGPYSDIEELNRVRGVLKQNGVDAALVKVREAEK